MELESAIRLIQSRSPLVPRVAIVLGSGLGEVADLIVHPCSIPYSEIPGFPGLSAQGHAGNLILGYLGGVPVVAMKGRAHLYEGHSLKKSLFPLECMGALGAEILVVSNASGGLEPRFRSGDLVLIDGHLDLLTLGFGKMKGSLFGPSTGSVMHSVPLRSREVYDESLMQQAQRIAISKGFSLGRGTYLATKGPTYETRAEYRFFRRIGADLVGMSTIPEVQLAARLGMKVLAFSVVTNVANPDAATKTTHEEVLDFGLLAQEKLTVLLSSLLSELSGPPD